MTLLMTGVDGVAHLNLDLEGIEPPPMMVTIVTKILGDGFYHESFWTVPIDPHFNAWGFHKNGFSVGLLGQWLIPARTLWTLDFIVAYDTQPMINKSIECLLYTDHEVLFNSTVQTDAKGLFNVDIFTPPLNPKDEWSGLVYAQFGIETENGIEWTLNHIQTSHWENEYQWLDQLTPETYLEVNRTSSPYRYNVTLRSPDIDGINESLWFMWWVDDIPYIIDYTKPGWYYWTYWNLVLIHNVTWTGQSYVGTIEIPYFLPSDIRISVTGTVVEIINPDGIRRCGYIHDLRTYIDNAPPTVEISSPENGEMTDRMIVVEGIASDDVSVETVLIRIDGEEWVKANGTETWRYDIGPEGLSEGSQG